MDSLAKPKNRALFLVSVAVTGAFAGAAVWLFFFAMEHGIDYLWTEIPHALGVTSPELASGPFGFLPYPFFVCLLGGLLIGLYEKLTGTKTDDLNQVMAKVKQDGRYPYDNLGKLSLAALLPLLFGGSIGPEAGLTGVIAGLCSWVGDRMRRFGAEFKELTLLGTQAALTALFTAPVFGFVAPLAGSADGRVPMTMSPRPTRSPSSFPRHRRPWSTALRLPAVWAPICCSASSWAAAWACPGSSPPRWAAWNLSGSFRWRWSAPYAVGCTLSLSMRARP